MLRLKYFISVVDGRKKRAAIESILELFVAEFVGTALLLFLGCMGCAVAPNSLPIATYHFHAFTFGLSVLICVQVSNISIMPLHKYFSTRIPIFF